MTSSPCSLPHTHRHMAHTTPITLSPLKPPHCLQCANHVPAAQAATEVQTMACPALFIPLPPKGTPCPCPQRARAMSRGVISTALLFLNFG